MPKYVKRPVVIEAQQFKFSNGVDIASWCGGTYLGGATTGGGPEVRIHTLEGDMTASVGDYVIRGVQGEFYPCKPSIFEATYEPVADD